MVVMRSSMVINWDEAVVSSSVITNGAQKRKIRNVFRTDIFMSRSKKQLRCWVWKNELCCSFFPSKFPQWVIWCGLTLVRTLEGTETWRYHYKIETCLEKDVIEKLFENQYIAIFRISVVSLLTSGLSQVMQQIYHMWILLQTFCFRPHLTDKANKAMKIKSLSLSFSKPLDFIL